VVVVRRLTLPHYSCACLDVVFAHAQVTAAIMRRRRPSSLTTELLKEPN